MICANIDIDIVKTVVSGFISKIQVVKYDLLLPTEPYLNKWVIYVEKDGVRRPVCIVFDSLRYSAVNVDVEDGDVLEALSHVALSINVSNF